MSAPLARREIRARPGRFIWLTVAVTVAVGFTVGAFGFSTQLTKLLDPAATGSTEVALLPEGSVVLTPDTKSITSATALDADLIARVRTVEGVAIAEGSYDQPVSFRLRRGEQSERPVILRGVVLSSTYSPDRWVIIEGRAPEGPDEVAVDAAGAFVGQTGLGDRTRLELPTGTRRVDVVGIAASANPTPLTGQTSDSAVVALASAHVILDEAVAPELLDAVGRVDRITVLPLPGTDPEVLERRLRDELPPGVIVSSALSRAALTQQTVARIDDGVQQAVAAVAGLTVLIASLVVMNTLSVLVAQRTREFGLLRLVGGSKAQVLRMVMGESLGVGIVGALLGFGLGIVLAYVAARVVRTSEVAVGFEATPRMALVALGVGVAVTAIGGVVPAIRAGRVAPLEALSDTRAGGERRARFWLPIVAVMAGAAMLFVGAGEGGNLSGGRTALVGAGVLVAFVGVAGLSRWIVGPLLAVCGAVLRSFTGAAGRLGVGNARRQPSRTAGAASTLMVGLALFGFVATVGASVRSTVESQFDNASSADLFLERRGVVRVSTFRLAQEVFRELDRGDEFAFITAVDGVIVGPNGRSAQASASLLADLGRIVDLGVTSGSVPDDYNFDAPAEDDASGAVVSSPVILSESTAKALDAAVGDLVLLRSISGEETQLKVGAVYANTAIAGAAVIDITSNVAQTSLGTFELGLVRFDGRDRTGGVQDAARDFPKVRVHTPESFGELNASVTDTVLRVIGVVLVGMIGIGYLGLVATLGLSTLERRKELVMLRAVGAERQQLRTMVWVEATLIGFIAAAVGLSVGVALGVAGATAAPEDLVARIVVPWWQLAAVAVLSLLIAWSVSLGVARRASFVPPAEAGR